MHYRIGTTARLAATSLAASALLVALSGLLVGAGGLNEQELLCEEAVARLTDCCPSLHTESIGCREDNGCNEIHPSLTVAGSRCVLDASCDAIDQAQICERLEHLYDYVPDAGPSSWTGGEEVCP
jgi:hypothetical protein